MPSPLVSYLSGTWQLEETFTWDGIKVPEGFRFDLASIPRPFWSLVAPFELSLAAPLVHDFIYRRGGVLADRNLSRAEADRLFLDIMKAEGVPAWRRLPAYLAVRAFGWTAWRSR